MEYLKSLDYRGIHVDFYSNDDYQQVHATLFDEEINFGNQNLDFETDAKFIIDEHLDLIYKFADQAHSKLMWFQNGQFRDIKLVSKNRILYVFLIDKITTFDTEKLNEIIKISSNILSKLYS